MTETTVHSAAIEEIHDVPMEVVIKPFPSVLDEEKVKSLMDALSNTETNDSVPPVDITWIQGSEGGNYYYCFGGCHRYEACRRLNKKTIRAKLVKASPQSLQAILGFVPNLK